MNFFPLSNSFEKSPKLVAPGEKTTTSPPVEYESIFFFSEEIRVSRF